MVTLEAFQLMRAAGTVARASCHLARRLGNDSGKAMIEFALIGPTFIAILCGIMEFSGIIFVQTLLEGGARQASRYGITGAVPAGMSREDMIFEIIGDNSFGVIDPEDVEVETLVYRNFADIGQPEPFTDKDQDGRYDPGETFQDVNGNGKWDQDMGAAGLGGPGDIVVYRLRYQWDIIIPLFEPFFGETVPIEANIAVRNEP